MLKRSLIALCSLLILTSAQAQIRGGGGPGESPLPAGMTKAEYVTLKLSYDKIIAKMNEQWQKCGNNSKLKFKSLSEAYLQLTWHDSAIQGTCAEEEMETITACFFDDQMKSAIKTLLDQREYRAFIRTLEDPVTEMTLYRYFSVEANREKKGKDE